MKKSLFVFLLISTFSYSQKYFLLDRLKTDFKVNEFTLNTDEIYNIKKQITIYNVFVSKNNILLLSILPDLEAEGQAWMPIDFSKIKDEVFSNSKLFNLVSDWNADNSPDKKTLRYKLIKKKNDKYYVSELCLTEFFTINSLSSPFITKYGTINITQPKVTIKQMANEFKKQIPKQEFIMDLRLGIQSKNEDLPYSFRNYLSKEFNIGKFKAYQFWTFDGWWNHDGYNEYRGIDRFVIIPEKGIVGGSYDFYFKLKPKISTNNYFTESTDNLWNNILTEKIMIAEELR